MNDCPNAEIRDLLPDLLHEGLSDSARVAVVAHVRVCVDCTAELELLRSVLTVVERATPIVDVNRIAAGIPPYTAALPAYRRWSGWRVAAAVVAIAVGGTSAALVIQGGGTQTGELNVAGTPALSSTSLIAGVDPSVPSNSAVTTVAAAEGMGDSHELSLAGGVSDLTEPQLRSLLQDLQGIEALPASEPAEHIVSGPVWPVDLPEDLR